jgi:hypothetical protein
VFGLFLGETFTGGKYNVPRWKTETDTNGMTNPPDFLSIEPLLAPVDITEFTDWNNWASNNFGKDKQVIIGAETGKRKDRITPKKEWVDDIVKQCNQHGVRVFMKENLHKIMGDDFRQDPLIWEVAR